MLKYLQIVGLSGADTRFSANDHFLFNRQNVCEVRQE